MDALMREFEKKMESILNPYKFKFLTDESFLVSHFLQYPYQIFLIEFRQILLKITEKYRFLTMDQVFSWIFEYLNEIHPNNHFFFTSKNKFTPESTIENQFSWESKDTFCELKPAFHFNSSARIEGWQINCILLHKGRQGSEKTNPKRYLIPVKTEKTHQYFEIDVLRKNINLFFAYRVLSKSERDQFSRNYQQNINRFLSQRLKQALVNLSDLPVEMDLDRFFLTFKPFLRNYTRPHNDVSVFYPKFSQSILSATNVFFTLEILPDIIPYLNKTQNNLESSTFIEDVFEIFNKICALFSKFENLRWQVRKKRKLILDFAYLIPEKHNETESFSPDLTESKQYQQENALDTSQSCYPYYSSQFKFKNGKFIRPYFSTATPKLHSIVSETFSRDISPNGIIVHGDNWDAMNLLKSIFHHRIDMIYVDPPYNTGTLNFTYQDAFKRSYWLSMMHHRLLLSRELLDPEGIFFSSIDDHQLATYSLLIDQCFPFRLDNIVWHKKTQPSYLSKELISVTEYIVGAKEQGKPLDLMGDFGNPQKLTEMINIGNKNSLRKLPKDSVSIGDHWTGILQPGFYGNHKLSLELLEKPLHVSNGNPADDILLKGRFKWTQDRIQEEIEKGGQIYIKSIQTLRPTIDRKYNAPIIKAPTTLLSKKINQIPTNTDANKELKNLFGVPPFDYSKPVGLIRYLIRAKTYHSKNGWILDFFAGSGTTAQAVLEQNEIDQGTRKYCLIENTDVFEDVLLPRITKLITSKKWEKGIPVEASGFPHVCQSISLESYNDFFLNCAVESTSFDEINCIGKIFHHYDSKIQNIDWSEMIPLQYLLEYQNDEYSINLDPPRFETPFHYYIYHESKGQIRKNPVNLVETFNFLMGIQVNSRKIVDHQKRPYIFIVGTRLPSSGSDNSKVLVIWRALKALNFTQEKKFIVKTWKLKEFSEIYINTCSEFATFEIIEPIFNQLLFSSEKDLSF